MGGNTIAPDNYEHVLHTLDLGLNYLETAPALVDVQICDEMKGMSYRRMFHAHAGRMAACYSIPFATDIAKSGLMAALSK